MLKKSLRLLLILCGCVTFGTIVYIIQGQSRTGIKGEKAVHAFVYNKPHVLLNLERIGNYEKTDEKISIYAELTSFEKVSDKKMVFQLKEHDQTLTAYSYQFFSNLLVGHTYLFEGYIENVDGVNYFIIEGILNL